MSMHAYPNPTSDFPLTPIINKEMVISRQILNVSLYNFTDSFIYQVYTFCQILLEAP